MVHGNKATPLECLHGGRAELLAGRGDVHGGRSCQVLQQGLQTMRPVREIGGVLPRLPGRYGQTERRPVLRRRPGTLPAPFPDDHAISEQPSQCRTGGGGAHHVSLLRWRCTVQRSEEPALLIAPMREVFLYCLVSGPQEGDQPAPEVPGKHQGGDLVEGAEGLTTQPTRQAELRLREGEVGVLEATQGSNAADLRTVGEGKDDTGDPAGLEGRPHDLAGGHGQAGRDSVGQGTFWGEGSVDRHLGIPGGHHAPIRCLWPSGRGGYEASAASPSLAGAVLGAAALAGRGRSGRSLMRAARPKRSRR